MAKKTERQLPDNPTIPFVICDNSVNRYGWRLLVEGIDTTGFLLNPVCCLQHNTGLIPVGKWENLRVEKSQFIGDVVFDPTDDESVKLYWKYKDGFMNACSLNVIPIEESDDPSFLLPGQKCATLTKSELLEVSLVTLPGQKNAVKLSHPDGKEYKLELLINQKTMTGEKSVEQLQAELAASHKLNADNLIALHKQRGVVTDAEVESLHKLALLDYASTSSLLSARVAVEKTDEGGKEQLAKSLVELHGTRLAFSADEKKMYENAATLDYDGTKKVLEARKGKETAESFVLGLGTGNNASAANEERVKWSYLDYSKRDPEALALMAKNEPDKHKALELAFIEESNKLGIKTTAEQ